METLKLNSNGKVIIPGLGNGKKKLIIKKLNDEIQHIPDTYSIDVDIESKQGLLPPERVTQKSQYQTFNYFKSNSKANLLSIPQGCNGFIPDYVDTENLMEGDIIYIIDPKHDDTSKYVLDANRQWSYAGDIIDPSVGGVEGYDYSNVQSSFGGFWVLRENNLDKNIKILKRELTKSGKQIIMDRNNYQNGDLFIQYNHYDEKILTTNTGSQKNIALKIWQFQDGEMVEITPLTTTLSELGLDNKIDLLKTHNLSDCNGIWVWTNTDRLAGHDPVWTSESVPENDILEQEIVPGSTNIISNPFDHDIDVNSMIEIDNPENITPDDQIIIPNGTTSPKRIEYDKTSGLWKYSGSNYKKVTPTMYLPQSCTLYHSEILGNQAFWYMSKGTEPLTIRFK